MVVAFSKNMVFPENLDKLINDSKRKNRKLASSETQLMTLSIAPDGSDTLDENLVDWKITEFSPNYIVVKVTFEEVLEVS